MLPVSSLPPAELDGFAEAEVVEHPDVFTVGDFAGLDDCRELIQAWREGQADALPMGGPWAHFDRRILRSETTHAWTVAKMLADGAAGEVEVRWSPDRDVVAEAPQLVWWPAPHGQWWHEDVPPDGTDDQRRYTSILYLNDGFAGGCTCFQSLRLKVRPVAGALVCFRTHLVHGVEDVREGERFTLASWHRVAA